jgi:hypothetical protein
MAKPSRSTHFVSIALRVSNVLRLGFATAALHRHPAKHAAISGCAPCDQKKARGKYGKSGDQGRSASLRGSIQWF